MDNSTQQFTSECKVSFYCLACGEYDEVEFYGLTPGANRYVYPNCETVFDVSIDFYEVEADTDDD